MTNAIAVIREKLEIYNKPFVAKDFLVKILEKFAPKYSIADLCDKGLLTPIKRGARYINKKSRSFVNPFVVADLYMGSDLYMLGGMSIYNRYSLSEQIAERHTIYNTKYSGNKIIGQAKFIFVRQRESFFYGMEEEKFEEWSYKVMSRERALIQMIREGKSFAGLPSGISTNKLLALATKNVSKNILSKVQKLCSSKK